MSKRVSAEGIGRKVKYNKDLWVRGAGLSEGGGLKGEWAYGGFDGFCETKPIIEKRGFLDACRPGMELPARFAWVDRDG